jgi:TolB-like protein/DNA-binding winged helix-turn-helix (wHTH) protein/Tfp pilus assembly protein PilF
VVIPAKPNVVNFGTYEFNLCSGELRKEGMRVRLEGQPLSVLQMLLDRPGELVTREELQQRLWPADTFVDFEHSLNAAVKRLRERLNDSADQPRFIETLARRGYRFFAPINGFVPEDRGSEQAVLVPDESRSRVAITFRLQRLWPFVAAAVCFGGIALWGWRQSRNRPPIPTVPAVRSLAVLPLQNLSGDPSQEYLADGMTEELIGKLSMIQGLRVISRTSVMRFKDTHPPVPEIAAALHVDAIVEGSVMREGNLVRVHAQLIRGATDEHLWSETYDRQRGEIFALESAVAQAIASKVEVSVTWEERARLAAAQHVSPEAYESYLKGMFAKDDTKAEVEQSAGYFEDAIRKDPTFAPAYVGLAGVYGTLGSPFVGAAPDEVRPKMMNALRKALELDPETANANLMLAGIYGNQWQWAESAAEYKRALALNPNDPAAHMGFSHWLLSQGRTEEAITWAQRASELDPLGGLGSNVGWILFQARHYDEAIRELRRVVAVNPEDAYAHWFLGFALIATGQPDQAIAPLEKARSLSGGSPAVIGVLVRAYAHAGRRTDALRLLDELKRRQQASYVPPVAFVNAYLGLGDNEQAFVWLERSYQEKAAIMQYLKVHPFLDPLRDDPRFANLVHRVGLDRAWWPISK